jgi:lipid-binding SYLF domain-containing protein
MKRTMMFIVFLLASAAAARADDQTVDKRLGEAADVFRDVMSAPDKGIPHGLLQRAKCIVIVPGMKKAAFVVGADYGKGFAVCRTAGGKWGAPDPVALSGGSFGLQLGVDSTDVILLVMGEKGLNYLLADKFAIGGDAAAAVGPVGRDAAVGTDVSMRAEILSWSRSHGLFAGVSLNGVIVTQDKGETKKLYGRELSGGQIISGNIPPPPTSKVLLAVLDRFAPGK